MDSVFIISPLVGSLIGYWTNWLAIKMLFRPLTKKEIFGFKIPFTPGVIPRRREELAESIGGTVGERLLTPDAFEEILQGPGMKNKVKQFIKEKIKNLEHEDRNIEQILGQVFTDKQRVTEMKELLQEVIRENIKKSLTNDNIMQLFKSKIDKNKKIEQIENYFASEEYSNLKKEIINLIQEESNIAALKEQLSFYFKQELENIDQDKTLEEVLPSSVINSLREWIEEQKPEVVNHVISFLESDELKEQIEAKVEKFFEDNPMLSMLSGFKDKIVEKFLNYLVSYAKEEENQEQIMQEIDELIDSLLKTPCSSIINKIKQENLEDISEGIVEKLITEGNINKLLSKLEQKLIDSLEAEEANDVLDLLVNKVLNSKLLLNVLDDIIKFKIEQSFNTPLSSYFKGLDSDIITKLETGVVNVIEYIMEHHLGAIFATLDFKKLVKEKINSFDVLEVERLLLDVIETELNAITWFGAVLGFLLGLITPIISLF